jgi:hypothetical protein
MPLPNKLKDLLIQKQDYINSQRDNLEKSVIDMQDKLLNKVIADAISELDTQDGKILNTVRNFKILSALDDVYSQFNEASQKLVVQKMANGLLGINTFNSQYFKIVSLNETTTKRFDSVIQKTNKLMSAKIGITDQGEIKTGGFLDSFISDNRLLTESKQLVSRGITGGQNITDVKADLKAKIVGTQDYTGGFERYYRQFAYDTFQEYDRSYSKNAADEFGMNYALYQGGLITDSRDFCIAHNNKVFTRDEIMQFGEWVLPDDTKEKPGPGEVPNYIANFPGYDPFTCCGGFNCRHSLGWVTKGYAIQLRPELK